jgi:hypothetical protein
MSSAITKLINYELNDDNEPYHIYVDLSLVNNNPAGQSVPLVFSDLRNTSLIQNPKDYFTAIVRFHIDTYGSLPAWIPQIQTGQSDVNKTVYSFTLAYKTTVFEAFLEFIPQNVNDPVKAPTNYQDMSSQYYYIYSYQSLFQMVNNTLQSAFTGLQTAVGSGFPSTEAPFILFDPIGKECVFNADSACYDVKNTSSPIYIYANNQMYNLISGFQWNCLGEAPNGQNYQLQIYNNYGTNTYTQGDYTLLQCYEEYPSITTLSPVQCVIFTSSTIPLEPTIVSNASTFNSTTSINSSSNSATSPVLTDFTIAVDINNNYFPSIDYESPAQYRLVDLYGSGDISNLQMGVYWKDIFNNTYPLNLPCGGSCSAKILFRRKDFNQ